MASCLICGDESRLTPVLRLWSPDDGWQMGRLCPYCAKTEATRQPHPDDYAYNKRGQYVSDEQDAIDVLFG
jgi:hypothetical protein